MSKSEKKSFCLRDGPFNLKGGGRGIMGFFSKKIWIPNVAEKSIF
jgi:hypothetical protein